MRRRTACATFAATLATALGGARAAGLQRQASAVPASDTTPSSMPRHGNGEDAGVSGTYFGMHFHRLLGDVQNRVPTKWPPRVTIGALRLWDSGHRWADLAPTPGHWDFARMDVYVDKATLHGAALMYTLGSPPRWASARPDEPGPYGPGCAAEPRQMSDWIDYVRRVVMRYRGRIEVYELWNEPNFSDIARDRGDPGFYSGSVATMVEMARSARAVIGELDPSAQLFTPGFVNGPDRLELFLRAGGSALVDGVAYHFYSNSSQRFSEQVGQVRAAMRRCGVTGLPLWNTETGVEAAGPDHGAASESAGAADTAPQRLAGAQLAQFLLLGAAEGIARFYDYAWDNEHTGMFDARGRDLPRLAAFAQVQSWMLGATLAPPQWLAGGAVLIWARRGAERFAFIWAPGHTVVTQALPRGWCLASLERLYEAPATPAAASSTSCVVPLSIGPAPLRLQLVPAQPDRLGST